MPNPTPAPTDADLIRHCAEILGWKAMNPEAINYLSAAFLVAIASGKNWHLSRDRVKVLADWTPNAQMFLAEHDGTERAAARALIVTVLLAAGRIG